MFAPCRHCLLRLARTALYTTPYTHSNRFCVESATLPPMVGTLFNGLRALLALPARTSRSFKAVEHAVRRIDERAEKARQADRQVTTQAFERLRQDVDERFQRLHLQLERITA